MEDNKSIKLHQEEDVLDKLLNAETDINDVYERRLCLIRNALLASGDTVNELVEFERKVFKEWIGALQDNNRELRDAVRFILKCIEKLKPEIKENGSQISIKSKNSSIQASIEDPLVNLLQMDIKTLVDVLQKVIIDPKYDFSGLYLRTLDPPIIKNLTVAGSEAPKDTCSKIKAMKKRINDLEQSLTEITNKNFDLMTGLTTLKTKMLEREQNFLQCEKESTDRLNSIERMYRIYLQQAKQRIKKQCEIIQSNNKLIKGNIAKDKLIIERVHDLHRNVCT